MLPTLSSCYLVLGLALCSNALSDAPPANESFPFIQLEMYAAVKGGDDISHPENLNLYDAAGLVNHLLTEIVVETGRTPERTARFMNVDTIVKYQMRILNPLKNPAIDTQGEFARYVTFQDGAAQPSDVDLFKQNGDLVGISYFHVNGDKRFTYDVVYYSFSLSGRCPNKPNGAKTSDCATYREGLLPANNSQEIAGGRCSNSSSEFPDGTPGCVYVVDNYQVANLDEIVGITNQDCGGRKCSSWQDFRMHCSNKTLQFEHLGFAYCREYDYPGCINDCSNSSCQPSNEVGIPFWLGRCDSDANAQRVAAFIKAFGGSKVDKHYAYNPRCDQYSPMCNKPIPTAGVAYCHRDQSGVCDSCYIPGTVTSQHLDGQVQCRKNLFIGKLPQYQGNLPQCSSDCSGTCSDESDEQLCCLYLGKCKQVWTTSDWGDCDVPCGNGTKRRDVTCPFEDLLGPCDESTRPENETICRGHSCPWNRTDFGPWGGCNNSCGAGNESRELFCSCPDDCPDGEKECEQSPKPPVPTRKCFTEPPFGPAAGHVFCASCDPSGSSCQACIDGFSAPRCQDVAHRLVEASFLVTSIDAQLDVDPLAGPLALAFELAFRDAANLSVKVASLSASSTESKLTALRRISFSFASSVKLVVVAVAKDDTDDELRQIIRAFASVNGTDISKFLPKRMADAGCNAQANCTVPSSLEVGDGSTSTMCPWGAIWDPVNGCPKAYPPAPPGPPGQNPEGFPIWAIAAIAAGAVLLVGGGAAYRLKCAQPRDEDSQRRIQLRSSSP